MDQKISENKMNIQILQNHKTKDPTTKIVQDLDHLVIKINLQITSTKTDKTNIVMKPMKEINTDQNQIMTLPKQQTNLPYS